MYIHGAGPRKSNFYLVYFHVLSVIFPGCDLCFPVLFVRLVDPIGSKRTLAAKSCVVTKTQQQNNCCLMIVGVGWAQIATFAICLGARTCIDKNEPDYAVPFEKKGQCLHTDLSNYQEMLCASFE